MKSLIVFIIFLSIIGSGISSASAATTHQVQSGASNSDIQTIIDQAHAGDTIQFLGSEYDNISLVINKTLNLVGAASGTVIKAISNSSYIPESVANDISNAAAFYFINGSSNSSISGFNITSMANSTSDIGYYNSLIYSLDVSGLKIHNNNLNFSSWGIYIDSSKNGNVNDSIYNNTISNMTTTGIINFGSANTLITNNTVLNCSNHGIDVRHGWGPNAIICGNLIDGANEGIYLMHSAGHDVYNNTILNCTLSSITAYGAANVNITNNTMADSFVGVLLASGFSNVNIHNNTYNLTSTPFPYTFPYYVMVADSSTGTNVTANGTFTDSENQVSNISMSSSYSSSSITNGKTTTYTVKVSNNGKGSANNITINNILPSSSYTGCQVNAVSRGSFNPSTGTWKIDNLGSGSDAIIVFTVTAKKAGSISTIPSASYNDNTGSNSLTAQKSVLTINKDVRPSYAYAVSSTKVKKGGYFYVTVTLKNAGIDTSGLCTVQDKLSTAFSKVSTSQTSPFTYSSSKWTGTIGPNKTIILKMKIKMNKKGKYTLPVLINGKTTKTYTITGY